MKIIDCARRPYLGLAAIAVLACGSPAPVEDPRRTPVGRAPASTDWERGMAGHWMRAPLAPLASDDDLAQLGALGYAPGIQAAPPGTGVLIHESKRAQPGFNLYCSGHDSEAILMDMAGTVLHRWRLPYDKVPSPDTDAHPWFSGSWRRVRLLPDGSLLAIFENLGLVKIDRDSKLTWYYEGRAHHDLDLLPDGTILVLTRAARPPTRQAPDRRIIEDFVTVLSPEGEEIRRINLLTAFHRSDKYRGLVQGIVPRGDIFHTNTIEVLDDRLERHGPAFRRGNILLSIRHLDAIAVLDPQTETIVWAATGSWKWQHEPTALDNGNLLLFDNQGSPEASRILELEPSTLDVVWSYEGDPPESFYSIYCGTARRLANGNTLITETCPGRAFEVAPSGEKVWEFVSPHRAGERHELVAALFDVIRLPDRPGWLDSDEE